MPHRSRKYYYASCVAGQGQSIAFSQKMPFNATLLQITVALGAVQTSDDTFLVIKDSVNNPIFDVELYAENFAIKEVTDVVIPCHYELRKGDELVITYANTDDMDVGIEVTLEEAH